MTNYTSLEPLTNQFIIMQTITPDSVHITALVEARIMSDLSVQVSQGDGWITLGHKARSVDLQAIPSAEVQL